MTFAQGARLLAGHAGLLLGWRPDEFWRVTPDELAAALGAFAPLAGEPASGIDRATMTRLKELYPDE